MGKKLNILPGARYNRFTVIADAGKKNGLRHFECRCDCGNIRVVRINSLTSGNQKSCGCYRHELLTTGNITHGLVKSALYIIWRGMKSRCTNPKKDHYDRYGGRGISVCAAWVNDFTVFMEWAYLNGYKEGLSIERENIDGNYEPSNCKWIELKAQALNRSNTKWIEYNNIRKPMASWARDLNISYQDLRNKIYNGKSFEQSVKELGGQL